MTLVPESIKTTSTEALDLTWEERLKLLKPSQLFIDLAHETNIEKLELWLEMFGVSLESIPEGLTTEQYQRLLQSIIVIYKLSGTVKSIQLLGYVLGADQVDVTQTYVHRYNGRTTYNGDYIHDSGALYRPFAVTLEISGVTQKLQFIEMLKKLFDLFEPVWIWLERIVFSDGTAYDSEVYDFNSAECLSLDFNSAESIDLDLN